MRARLKNFCVVALLAGGAALLPAGGHTDNTAVVNINQSAMGLQICGDACVQNLHVYNIAVVFVVQGPDFAPALGAAYITPPGTGDFGPVVHAKARDFVLMNTSGSQPLLVAAIGMSGANPDDFTTSTNCGIFLPPGGKCTIRVTFGPRDLGGRSAVLAVRDSAADSPQRVSLAGTGVAPTLSPDPVQLEATAIGSRSPAKTATLHNPGTDPLTVQSVSLEGASASEFQAGPCGVVPGGGSCAVPVTFQPADAGPRTAMLAVRDDGLGGPRRVSLQGVGVPLRLSPGGLDFGAVLVGKASPSQEIVLENRGISNVIFTSIGFNGGSAADFGFTTSCGALPATLLSGMHCSVNATLKPSAPGPRSSSLGLHYTAGGVGFDAAAAVAGTGIQPGFAVSPDSLDFGAVRVGQPAAAQTLVVSNPGTAPTHLGAISVIGANPKDFVQAGTCATLAGDLAPGDSCQVTVTFTPRAAGSRGASVMFVDNAPGTPHLVLVTGQGTTAPVAPAPASAAAPPPVVHKQPAPAPVAYTPPAAPATAAVAGASATSLPVAAVGGAGDRSNSNSLRFTSEPLGAALPAVSRPVPLSVPAGPCLVAFVSPVAGMVAWLAVLVFLFLIGVGVVARRRLRDGQ